MTKRLQDPVSVVVLSLLIAPACPGDDGRPAGDAGRQDAAVPEAGVADASNDDGGPDDAGAPGTDASPDASTSPEAPGPRVDAFTDTGPILATAGQVIEAVRITNPDGPCITISEPNVVVRDSDIGPCGGEANIDVTAGGDGALVEHNDVHDGNRGVMARSTAGVVTRANRLFAFAGPAPRGTAIEYDYMQSGEIDANEVRGAAYASDAVSVFESSGIRLTGNDIDVDVAEPSAAAFTMGDALEGHDPGADNFVADNVVHQTGGVPAGVFGSTRNTVLERNCLTAGIQAYAYNGNTFVGVVIRNNVIDLGASFVPDTSVIEGWDTNIDGTDCSLVPR